MVGSEAKRSNRLAAKKPAPAAEAQAPRGRRGRPPVRQRKQPLGSDGEHDRASGEGVAAPRSMHKRKAALPVEVHAPKRRGRPHKKRPPESPLEPPRKIRGGLRSTSRSRAKTEREVPLGDATSPFSSGLRSTSRSRVKTEKETTPRDAKSTISGGSRSTSRSRLKTEKEAPLSDAKSPISGGIRLTSRPRATSELKTPLSDAKSTMSRGLRSTSRSRATIEKEALLSDAKSTLSRGLRSTSRSRAKTEKEAPLSDAKSQISGGRRSTSRSRTKTEKEAPLSNAKTQILGGLRSTRSRAKSGKEAPFSNAKSQISGVRQSTSRLRMKTEKEAPFSDAKSPISGGRRSTSRSRAKIEKEALLGDANSTISSLEKDPSLPSKQVAEQRCANLAAEERASSLEENLEAEQGEAVVNPAEVEGNLKSIQGDNEDVRSLRAEKEAAPSSKVSGLLSAKETVKEQAATLKEKLHADQAATTLKLTDLEEKLEAATKRVASLQNANDDAKKLLLEKDAALDDLMLSILSLKGESSQATLQHSDEVAELRKALEVEQKASASKLDELQGKLEESSKSNTLLANQVTTLQNDGDHASKLLSKKEAALSDANSTISSLKEDTSQLSAQVSELRSANVAAEERASALDQSLEAKQRESAEKLAEVEGKVESLQSVNENVMRLLAEKESVLLEAQNSLASLKEESSSKLSNLFTAKEVVEKQAATLKDQLDADQAATTAKLMDLEAKLQAAMKQVASLQNAVHDAKKLLLEKDAALDNAKSSMTTLQEDSSKATLKHSDEVTELRKALEAEQAAAALKLDEVEDKLEKAAKSNSLLENQIISLQNDGDHASKLLTKKEAALSDANSTISSLKEDASQLSAEVAELRSANVAAEERASALEQNFEAERAKAVSKLAEVEGKVASLQDDNEDVTRLLAEKEAVLLDTQNNIASLKEESSSKLSELLSSKEEVEKQAATLKDKIDADQAATTAKLADLEGKLEAATKQVASLRYANDDAKKLLLQKDAALDDSKSAITALKEEASRATSQLSDEVAKLRKALDAEQALAASKLNEVEGKLEEAAKSNSVLVNQVTTLQNDGHRASKLVTEKEAALSDAKSIISSLKEETSQLSAEVAELRSANVATEERASALQRDLGAEQRKAAAKLAEMEGKVAFLHGDNKDVKRLLAEKEGALANAKHKFSSLKEESSSKISELLSAKETVKKQAATLKDKLDANQAATTAKLMDLQGKLKSATKQVASLKGTNDDAKKLLLEKDAALNTSKSSITVLKEKASRVTSQLSKEVAELRKALEAEQAAAALKLDQVEGKLYEAAKSNTLLENQVTSLQDDASKLLAEKEVALSDAKSLISSLKENNSQLSAEVAELRSANVAAEERASALEHNFEAEQAAAAAAAKLTEVKSKVASLQGVNEDMTRRLKEKEATLLETQNSIASLKVISSSKISELLRLKEAVEKQVATLKDKLDADQAATSAKLMHLEGNLEAATKQVASLQNANDAASKLLLEKDAALDNAKISISVLKEQASQARSQLSNEVAELRKALEVKQAVAAEKLDELQGKLKVATESNTLLVNQVTSLQDDSSKLLAEKEMALSNTKSAVSSLREDCSQSSDKAHETGRANMAAEERASALEQNLGAEQGEAAAKLVEVDGKVASSSVTTRM